MIVLDANLLLYAYDSACAEHQKAHSWLETVFSGHEPIGLPWQTISAFVRVHTNSRLPGDRFTTEEAVRVIDEWMDLPQVRLLFQDSSKGFTQRSPGKRAKSRSAV